MPYAVYCWHTCEVDRCLQVHHSDVTILGPPVVDLVEDDAVNLSGLCVQGLWTPLAMQAQQGLPVREVHVLPAGSERRRERTDACHC